MRQPLASHVIEAAAEHHGVCTRPFVMEVADYDTGELRYVPVPCGATIESTCRPCARKARALRMAQCREGWHRDTEPDFTPEPPTGEQTHLIDYRADLLAEYRTAQAVGDRQDIEELREEITAADDDLKATGVRGRLPHPDAKRPRRAHRSTKRRHDIPDLPRRRVENHTLGREYAGGYRPSMFVTLTCDTYGPVHRDGTPRDPDRYDYRQAARDAVHFAALTDRWWQNLRRCVGWDVQYFATVEPQKRAAPHLHAAIRGSIPHAVLRQVTAATYHQVWWPAHDRLVYAEGDALPVWDADRKTFLDPTTRAPLTTWEEAVDQVEEPAHVARFGPQVHSKGILGGSAEAGRHIGYLTKYLTKSVGEVVEHDTGRQRAHADRLHAELARTPCSPRCAVWLLYGVQPRKPHARMRPGRCTTRAHRRSTLGLPGRRVLVSRKWSGKSLADHRADRRRFVTEMLAAAGIDKPTADSSRVVWQKVRPGDPNVPSRADLLLRGIAERRRWRAEYDRALALAQPPPGTAPDVSATDHAA
ncbi:replication initiator [Actinoalloteichus caeruleus]|uniref:replication initiator n=1 Tax=Actinoalloteichus cyanogriseus TaxID=2893586 RepID=UPI003BB8FD34